MEQDESERCKLKSNGWRDFKAEPNLNVDGKRFSDDGELLTVSHSAKKRATWIKEQFVKWQYLFLFSFVFTKYGKDKGALSKISMHKRATTVDRSSGLCLTGSEFSHKLQKWWEKEPPPLLVNGDQARILYCLNYFNLWLRFSMGCNDIRMSSLK